MSAQPAVDTGMTLVEHLTELRKRLIICALAVRVGMLVGFILYEWVFDFLIAPYKDIATADNAVVPGKLVVFDPLEGFSVRIKTSAYTGIALAMPVLLWQIWQFVTPGLYPHERRYAVPFVASALVLFSPRRRAGVLHAAPRARLPGEHRRRRLGHGVRAGKYFQLITYMMLAFGIGFEFPIVLIFLQMAGIVEDRDAAHGSALRHRGHPACWWR